jgi:hypothetical protein
MKKIWTVLNSQVIMLFLGFILTSIVGTMITERIQKNNREKEIFIEREKQQSAWERDKKYEIFKRKLDDGEKVIDELSNLMNTRFFKMQNEFLAINAGNYTDSKWNEYYKSVEEWNIKMPLIVNKIKRLVSDTLYLVLNNYETDDENLKEPTSIHGMFYITHKYLLQYYNKKKSGIDDQILKEEINNKLRDLDIQTDDYIDLISDTYLKATLNFETHLDSLLKR